MARTHDPQPMDGPANSVTAETVESPLRREAHGGFGERSGETGREQSRHRAPGLLSEGGSMPLTSDHQRWTKIIPV